jgi:hypothetical protein
MSLFGSNSDGNNFSKGTLFSVKKEWYLEFVAVEHYREFVPAHPTMLQALE